MSLFLLVGTFDKPIARACGWLVMDLGADRRTSTGLADTLHSELMLYGVSVSIFFPGTMQTPGLDEENKVKPALVRKIEEGDGENIMTADQAALALWQGIERGEAHITADLTTSLFRASTRGAAPRSSWLLDGIFDLVAYVRVNS